MKDTNIYTTAINALVGKTKSAYHFRAEKWNLNRARAARYMSFIYYAWLRYGETAENAYNYAIRTAAADNGGKKRGFIDADIADLLNTALIAIITDETDTDDFVIACRAIDNAMNALHDERRTITSEKEFTKLCALNIRDMKRAATVNDELKTLFTSVITDDLDLQICDLLSSGNSHSETANILNMIPQTVDYRVKRMNKNITREIMQNPTYSKYLE